MSDKEPLHQILSPSIKVQLSDELEATIWPLGVRHLSTLSEKLGLIVRRLAVTPFPKGDADKASSIMAVIAPMVLEDFLDLVDDCTELKHSAIEEDIPFDQLPLEHIPLILDPWLEASFGEGKWANWMPLLSKIFLKATGEEFSISAITSRFSSSQGTDEETS